MSGPPDLAELCPRCKRRHLVELPCWAGRYAQVVRELVLEMKGTTCWLCGRPGATTADHVKPRSRGGTDALDNLAPAHAFCNTGRGAADPRPTTVPTERTDRW
jgi:5-methylcytosine-specific restriction endonuclease McrA